MEYTIEDIESILSIRSQLIVLEDHEFHKIYQKQDYYMGFLSSVIALINLDGTFLLCDKELRNRVRRVIQQKRFEQNHLF